MVGCGSREKENIERGHGKGYRFIWNRRKGFLGNILRGMKQL